MSPNASLPSMYLFFLMNAAASAFPCCCSNVVQLALRAPHDLALGDGPLHFQQVILERVLVLQEVEEADPTLLLRLRWGQFLERIPSLHHRHALLLAPPSQLLPQSLGCLYCVYETNILQYSSSFLYNVIINLHTKNELPLALSW